MITFYILLTLYSLFTVTFTIYSHVQNIFGIYYFSLKILIWSKTLTLLFGYFQQDNYKIEFLVRRLGTRLHFEYYMSFHPNSLIS